MSLDKLFHHSEPAYPRLTLEPMLLLGRAMVKMVCYESAWQPKQIPQTGELKEWELIVSQFWKLEVQDEDISAGLTSSEAPLHGLSSPCVFAWFSLCVPISFFCEDISHMGLGPTLMTSL